MTTFFNQKQDVIDIELTKYGEYLLSLGKFKPVYYSFFDNNVLYDPRYAGYSGSQNDYETRIQSETPSSKTQHSFEGRGEQVLSYNLIVADNPRLREDQKIRFPSTVDKHFTALNAPLGHSDISADKAPAWKMRFYNNEIRGSTMVYTGSHSLQKIPQVEATIKYKTRIKSINMKPESPEGSEETPVVADPYQPVESDPALQEGIFPDGTFVSVQADHILLDLEEINSRYERENFDIEIYEIKTETLSNGGSRENLIPMNFRKKKQEIVNNILVETDDVNVELDSSFTEYFFDVFVDSEIDEATICSSLSNLKAQGVYIETEFKCPDLATSLTAGNIYPDEDIESEKCEIDSGVA
jgi:hypothetical protein